MSTSKNDCWKNSFGATDITVLLAIKIFIAFLIFLMNPSNLYFPF